MEVAERSVALPQGEVRLAEAGPTDGPPVILLHGFPDTWRVWRRQIPALAAAGLRVIAPNLRGYPGSFRPKGVAPYRIDRVAGDVADLATALGVERFSLVGHDWGGLVAWRAALQLGARIERLAVLDAPHPAVVAGEMRRHPEQILKSSYIAFFQLPWLPERLLAFNGFAAIRRSLTAVSSAHAFPPEELSDYARGWSEPGALSAMLNYYRALRFHPPALSPRVAAATLVIWGRSDPFLGTHLAQASLAHCADGRSEVMDGGHWIQLDQAEAVNGLLAAHLRPEVHGLAQPPRAPTSGTLPNFSESCPCRRAEPPRA
jgi:pimeloyl-ACP methyl ester carboxylesterase